MTERSLYILPVRAVLLVLVGMLIVGALGGAVSSWFIVQRFAEKRGTAGTAPSEPPPPAAGELEDTFSQTAETVRRGVVGVLDGRGNVLHMGVVLTADGLLVTPLHPSLRSSARVVTADGTVLPGVFLREYPETGLMVLRVSGSFPAPRIAGDDRLLAGVAGVALRTVPDAATVGVSRTTIEHVRYADGGILRDRPGVERVGVLVPDVETSYHGAPLYDREEYLLGIVLVTDDRHVLLPGSTLDAVLQDVLRHPTGEAVAVLDGVRGAWITGDEATRRLLPGPLGFGLEAVPTQSAAGQAGFRSQDVIVGIGGKPLAEAGNLWVLLLDAARNGKTVTLDVQRDEQKIPLPLAPRVSPR